MKRIFVIDWALVPLFLLTAYTGIRLHIAGHGTDHELWHDWAVFHVLVSLLFFGVALLHVATHLQWYRKVVKKGIDKKSRITTLVSVVFLLASLSGIALFWVNGKNSALGIAHYKIGIVAIVLWAGHLLKRIRILLKSRG